MNQRQHYKLWLWMGLAIAAFILVCLLSPAKALLNEEFLIQEFKQMGAYSPLFFVLVFILALSLGFPGNVLAVAGGAVYGIGWGTLWGLVGSTLGAIVAFCLARSLLHDWVNHQFGSHPLLQRLNQAIARYPLTFVLAVRFTPLSPFSLVNFLFGLTPIDLKTYTIGTFFGLIPLSFAYSWLGASGNTAFHGGDRLPLMLALGLLLVLSVLPIFTRRPESGTDGQAIAGTKTASVQRHRF